LPLVPSKQRIRQARIKTDLDILAKERRYDSVEVCVKIQDLYSKVPIIGQGARLPRQIGGVIMENNKGAVVVPEELVNILKDEYEAREFFESLTNGYKRGYCDWVGGAKQRVTRETRAGKALLMLRNKQKTLKT